MHRRSLCPLLRIVALAVLLADPSAQAQERHGRASLTELGEQINQVNAQIKTAEDNLRVVETEYTDRIEPTEDEAMLRRFSEGEIQYLLGDFTGASVLFYDLIANDRFKTNAKYPDALFFLSDALYQQQNYLGARLYLRELLGLNSTHYRAALSRYLEIAGRLNEFTGIDNYIAQARGPSGELPAEIAYVYGKWFFRRSDLSKEERLRRAAEVFIPLAADPGGHFRLQSAYFLAVGDVQAGNLPAAVERFRRIASERANGDRELKVKELANLSMGRLLYELGKYDEAIDHYQEIPRESEYFVESLYEIAWAQVKKGEFERAKNAADILLLVSPDSTTAPEAQILQAHLLLKLHRYGEATDTYTQVINGYAPVRDEIDALLTVNKDPVAYFDNLLARNDRNLDVNSLLPPVAIKWATTQREVADAVRMMNNLEAGRHGVGESEEIAAHILKALEERGLETFPALQEGYTRADAVDSALTRAEESLVRIEGYVVQDRLTADQRRELERFRLEDADLRKRFESLPATQKELEDRKRRMRERVDEVDSEAFKLGYEVHSMFASITALGKWLDDTRSERRSSPTHNLEEEKAFIERVNQESATLTQLQNQLEHVRQVLADERASADASIAGEDVIRSRFQKQLGQQHALMAEVEPSLPADAGQVIARAHEARSRAAALRERVNKAKTFLRAQVAKRGRQIRDQVSAEQALLSSYSSEVSGVSGEARNLVGRIAFDSFKRVRQQFYDLVLKADVGLVDVAFTRKQDKTVEIQKLSAQKDRELRVLDNEFKEVLRDVD